MADSSYERLVHAVGQFEHTITTIYERMRDEHAEDEQLHRAFAIMAKESARHLERVGTEIRDHIPQDPFASCESLRRRLQLETVRRVGTARRGDVET